MRGPSYAPTKNGGACGDRHHRFADYSRQPSLRGGSAVTRSVGTRPSASSGDDTLDCRRRCGGVLWSAGLFSTAELLRPELRPGLRPATRLLRTAGVLSAAKLLRSAGQLLRARPELLRRASG